MKAGDIAIASLPQANREIKKRPVVLLKMMPPFDDFLVCGISTQLRHEVRQFDEVINESDSDFNLSGLKKPSLIRMGYLLTLPAEHLNGAIGNISNERLARLRSRLSEFLLARD